MLPNRDLTLVPREDGGNLIVNPPREVWDRSELSFSELSHWSALITSTARAMIDTLPQLDGGCINYWDAGNWALNDRAAPEGPKSAREYRKTHMHLLGRSRTARSLSWRWGEAPKFPDFQQRHAWAAGFTRLTPSECANVTHRAVRLLNERYRFFESIPSHHCASCSYPSYFEVCEECAAK